jgi:hypothetical protein
MSGPKKRTPPANAGGAVKELGKGSATFYNDSCNEAHPPKTLRRTACLHWAMGDHLQLLTVNQGTERIIVRQIDGGFDVLRVVRATKVVRFCGTFRSEAEAVQAGEEIAERRGVDYLTLEGKRWRSEFAYSKQLGKLRKERITHSATLSKGRASDLIALAETERILRGHDKKRKKDLGNGRA